MEDPTTGPLFRLSYVQKFTTHLLRGRAVISFLVHIHKSKISGWSRQGSAISRIIFACFLLKVKALVLNDPIPKWQSDRHFLEYRDGPLRYLKKTRFQPMES